MDEVIAYIKTQDEKIKNLETNEKVRELKIVELTQQYKSMVSKCGGQATNKVKLQKKVVEKDEEIKKLKEENEKLMKEQYKLLDEKESLSTTFWTKNEELKKENNELKFGVYIIQEALEKRVKEIVELKENQECEEDGYCISTWFREKLDIYIKYQFTQDGGEYTYHFQPNERPTCLDDLFEKYEKLKEKNDKFTKMFDELPNDMDIYYWDDKREWWRHDKVKAAREEVLKKKREEEEQEKFRIGADLPEGCYR